MTIAGKAMPYPADQVSRQFRAPCPNAFWLSEPFSDWGRGIRPLLVPAAPVGRSLLSAVGALAASGSGRHRALPGPPPVLTGQGT